MKLTRRITIRSRLDIYQKIKELQEKLRILRLSESEIIRVILSHFIENFDQSNLVEFRKEIIKYRKRMRRYPKILHSLLTEDIWSKVKFIRQSCSDLNLKNSSIFEFILFHFFNKFDDMDTLKNRVKELVQEYRLK